MHKNIGIKELKKQNKKVTKKRIDKLLHDITNYIKENERPILSPSDPVDVRSTAKKFDTLIINIDGASRGNPGKSGIGVAIFDKDLKLIK